jgi:hypothetical protein
MQLGKIGIVSFVFCSLFQRRDDTMEFEGVELRIGQYVRFSYDEKPRYAYRSFNYVDKITGETKITNLEHIV